MSNEPFPISDRHEWLRRAQDASILLDTLSADEFYSESVDHYHPVRQEIAVLVWSLDTDVEAFGAFLEAYPQTNGWLPNNAGDLQAMSTEEVKFRICRNVADERWVSGSLSMPFKSGTLKVALDRVIVDFAKFLLKPA